MYRTWEVIKQQLTEWKVFGVSSSSIWQCILRWWYLYNYTWLRSPTFAVVTFLDSCWLIQWLNSSTFTKEVRVWSPRNGNCTISIHVNHFKRWNNMIELDQRSLFLYNVSYYSTGGFSCCFFLFVFFFHFVLIFVNT